MDAERFVLRQPDEHAEPLHPVVSWVHEFIVHIALVDDERVLEMATTTYLKTGRAQARADGYDLLGEPEITHEPVVWVENWNEDGGALVGMPDALMYGCTEPTARRYRILWRAFKAAA